jgi:hypothetical protein
VQGARLLDDLPQLAPAEHVPGAEEKFLDGALVGRGDGVGRALGGGGGEVDGEARARAAALEEALGGPAQALESALRGDERGPVGRVHGARASVPVPTGRGLGGPAGDEPGRRHRWLRARAPPLGLQAARRRVGHRLLQPARLSLDLGLLHLLIPSPSRYLCYFSVQMLALSVAQLTTKFSEEIITFTWQLLKGRRRLSFLPFSLSLL